VCGCAKKIIYIVQTEIILRRIDFRMAKKKPFGGYAICFKGRKETVEQVFGKAPLAPSAMTKKIWVFVKKKRLAHK